MTEKEFREKAARVEGGKQEAAETAAGNSKTAGNATAAGDTIAAGDSITAGEASADGETDLTEMPEEGMRTVQTDKGPVEIPVNPQVIVSDYYLGEFLAVDVKPVIASPYSLSNPFLKGMVEGIQELNTVSAETSLEMIVAKEPDLIVTITEADYEKYAQSHQRYIFRMAAAVMKSCFTTSQVLWEKRRKRKHILLISGKERRRPGKKSGKLWEIVPFLLWRYGRSRSIPWAVILQEEVPFCMIYGN